MKTKLNKHDDAINSVASNIFGGHNHKTDLSLLSKDFKSQLITDSQYDAINSQALNVFANPNRDNVDRINPGYSLSAANFDPVSQEINEKSNDIFKGTNTVPVSIGNNSQIEPQNETDEDEPFLNADDDEWFLDDDTSGE